MVVSKNIVKPERRALILKPFESLAFALRRQEMCGVDITYIAYCTKTPVQVWTIQLHTHTHMDLQHLLGNVRRIQHNTNSSEIQYIHVSLCVCMYVCELHMVCTCVMVLLCYSHVL